MAHILVVDDVTLVRYALTSLLMDNGHIVTEAKDGKCAIDELETTQFDLVITDVFMPERDGIEVIRHLRDRHHQTKIIAISGGGLRQDAQAALTVTRYIGADVNLQKPIENGALLAAVDSLTGVVAHG